jgi:hypothetical protein
MNRATQVSHHASSPLDRAKQLASTLLSERGEAEFQLDQATLRAAAATYPAGATAELPRHSRRPRRNWSGNNEPRGIEESFGIMVNYLYDHDSIEDNHERFVREAIIARSPDVDALLGNSA